jgi:hypothetical protein
MGMNCARNDARVVDSARALRLSLAANAFVVRHHASVARTAGRVSPLRAMYAAIIDMAASTCESRVFLRAACSTSSTGGGSSKYPGVHQSMPVVAF